MPDDADARLRAAFVELCERPPRSEEELQYRLEPFEADRAAAVVFLLDRLAEPEAHDLAAAALHHIVADADLARLLSAFRDDERPPMACAEIAQLLAGVAGDRLSELLTPEELARLSALSLETLLSRYRERSGLGQILALYRHSSPSDRRVLLDAIEAATRGAAEVRLGMALDPLFPEEEDPAIRNEMIRRLASRAEPASARALAHWAARTRGEERRRIKEALRKLARGGVRTPPREGPVVAWMSGVDGTGCYSIGISFPTALGLRDLVLACIGLDAGLRAVSVLAAVDTGAVSEIRESLEGSQGIPVAGVDPATALRRVHQARRRTDDLGRPLPPGWTEATPYLGRTLVVAAAEPTREPVGSMGPTAIETLLEHPAYGSWVFFAEEIPAEEAAAVCDLLPQGEELLDGAQHRRLRWIALRALRRLEGSRTAARLSEMLRHQELVHRFRAEPTLAVRAAIAAAEIEEKGLSKSRFAVRLMERSLRALHAPGGRAARPEVRETFKRAIERLGPIRRREVLVLNLAEALFREIEDRNESLSPMERLTLEQIERLSLAAAEKAATEFTRGATEQATLPGVAAPLPPSRRAVGRRLRNRGARARLQRDIQEVVAAEGQLPKPQVDRFAAALATVAHWFAEEVCLRRCGEACLTEPCGDGRDLFYSPAHPAGLEATPSLHGPPNFAPAANSMRRQLARRLERSIAEITDFLGALDSLSAAHAAPNDATAETSGRRRLREILARLRAVRTETDQLPEDPASIYSHVEEMQALRDEMRPTQRALLVTALEKFAELVGTPLPPRVDREIERSLRRLGLHEIAPRALSAAFDRLGDPAPLRILLRGASGPSATAQTRTIAALFRDLEIRAAPPNATPDRRAAGGREDLL